MRVVVATVAHRGDDARIVHRQARALLEAGHSVVLIAPDPGEPSRRFDPEGLERLHVPRATGRHRARAWWRLSLVVRKATRGADLLLVHDPELLPLVAFRRLDGVLRVWDVHEDYFAYAPHVSWLGGRWKWILQRLLKLLYWVGRRRFKVILAEESYRQDFPGAPVIRNTTYVSDEHVSRSNPVRVVYVGRISNDRGCSEMIDIGRRLNTESGISLVLVGPCDSDCDRIVRMAMEFGWLDWRGALSHPEARSVIRGSLCGLSLLHDVANYQNSLPSKMFDYWSEGVPVIATPLRASADLVRRSRGGVLVSACEGQVVVEETVRSALELKTNEAEWEQLSRAGWEYVRENANWSCDGREFERLIRTMTDVRSET